MNVGDKVICINDEVFDGAFKKGQVYTVAELSHGMVRLIETGNIFWAKHLFAPYNVNKDVFHSLKNMGWKEIEIKE